MPWRAAADALLLSVRLTPRGGRDGIEGIETRADGRAVLKARVRAVAERGAANAALEALVAGWLGVPKTAVAVTAGATARVKTLRIDGDPGALEAALRQRLGAAP